LPNDLSQFQQVLLQKQTLDIFESRHARRWWSGFPELRKIAVFGVVTEYCVRFAAKGLLERGHRVCIVRDAIETLNPEESRKTLDELADDRGRPRQHRPAMARFSVSLGLKHSCKSGGRKASTTNRKTSYSLLKDCSGEILARRRDLFLFKRKSGMCSEHGPLAYRLFFGRFILNDVQCSTSIPRECAQYLRQSNSQEHRNR